MFFSKAALSRHCDRRSKVVSNKGRDRQATICKQILTVTACRQLSRAQSVDFEGITTRFTVFTTMDRQDDKDTLWKITVDFLKCVKLMFFAFCTSCWKMVVPPPLKSVKDEVILITGSASGIGRQLAVEFAKLGAILVLWDVDEENNDLTASMVKRHGVKCFIYNCDLGQLESIKNTAKRVKEEVGDVSILINNAGVVYGKKLLDTPDSMVERTIRVNLLAHFWTVKCFLPSMILRNHGHIVNIGSSAGLVGLNKLTDYCAAKFGITGFTEVLHYEMVYGGHTGICTTLVCPSFVNTGLFHGCKIRFPKLLPPLETEGTTKAIVHGILTEQNTIYVPKSVYFLTLMKFFLPTDAFVEVKRFMGAHSFMDFFIGRPSKESPNMNNDIPMAEPSINGSGS